MRHNRWLLFLIVIATSLFCCTMPRTKYEDIQSVTVKVRIFVEAYHAKIDSETQDYSVLTFAARTSEEICDDIKVLERVYQNKLKIYVDDVNFIDPIDTPIIMPDHLDAYDSVLGTNMDTVNIYYIYPHSRLVGFYGYAGGWPWGKKPSNIFIMTGSANHTLAHEIGHSLGGLLHTFEEDYIDDTPETDIPKDKNIFDLIAKDLDPNKDNIMSYSGGTKLTNDQMERFFTVLNKYHSNKFHTNSLPFSANIQIYRHMNDSFEAVYKLYDNESIPTQDVITAADEIINKAYGPSILLLDIDF